MAQDGQWEIQSDIVAEWHLPNIAQRGSRCQEEGRRRPLHKPSFITASRPDPYLLCGLIGTLPAACRRKKAGSDQHRLLNRALGSDRIPTTVNKCCRNTTVDGYRPRKPRRRVARRSLASIVEQLTRPYRARRHRRFFLALFAHRGRKWITTPNFGQASAFVSRSWASHAARE